MATIPEGFKDVLTQKKAFASLATVGLSQTISSFIHAS